MGRMFGFVRCRWVALLVLLSLWASAEAYEIDTHEAISEAAVRGSSLDSILKSVLGFEGGIEQSLNNRTVLNWVRLGSAWEDDLLRFFFHFHDPLRSWDDSGFGVGLLRSQSSIRWAQNEYQGWSWPKVRAYFLQALTAERAADRDQAFADTFRGLGQLIHLIQDAASPAHTRNDGHIAYNYETLVLDVQRQLEGDPDRQWFVTLLANLRMPASGWQSLPSNPLAPAPIARLFDTDKYVGNNPAITTDSIIGLAEYTNANFFSEDRTFPKDTNFLFRYPYPVASSVREADYPITLKTGDRLLRRYFIKTGDGETGYRLATVGFLRDYLQRYGLDPNRYNERHALDESVYKDYAERLLPRAVGYSAGLLDYFFRGDLDVKREADPATGLPSLSIVNRSPEPLGEGGVLTLYLDDSQGTRSAVSGASLTLSDSVPKENDDTPLRLSLPADLPEAGLSLVYQGPLGLEPKAVIGKALAEIAVEQVYRDWLTNEWILRTKDDLYVLPLESATVLGVPLAQVTWGDRDNQLVGLTAPTGDGPYEALLFELDRPLGSSMVRTTGDVTPSGYPIAGVRLLNRIALYETLNAINLNTTATISIRRDVAQYVITYTSRQTCDWREGVAGWSGDYDCTITIGGDTLTRARSWSDTLQYEFQLRLTPEQHAKDRWSARPPKYWWTLEQVRADRNGHVVAVMEIAGPQVAPEDIRTIPLRAFDQDGSLVESEMAVTVGGDLDPIHSPAFRVTVVVDLTTGQLLGKTATDSIVLDLTDRIVVPGRQGPFCVGFSESAEFRGGYWDGKTLDYRMGDCRNGSFFGIPAGTPRQVALTIADREGMYADRADGLVRDSLAALGLGINPAAAIPPPDPSDLAYRWSADGTTFIVLRLPGEPESLQRGKVTWKRWFGPIPGRLGLWVVGPTAYWTEDTPVSPVSLVSWNLKEDTASVIYNEASEDPPFPILSNAGGVLTVREDDDGWLWIPWRGATSFIPDLNEFDAWDYVTLDPAYLYNVWTGHFHTLRPGLPEEAGPPPLVFGDETEGEYHVVGR